MAPATVSKDPEDTKEAKETADRKALVCSLVDFYFFDFNLPFDKQLRTLLEDSHAITVDQLLAFKKKINSCVEGDRSALVDLLAQCSAELQYAHYDADKELISRNPEKPFASSKNIARGQSGCVVHLSKLPKDCTMATIRQWSDTIAPNCSIQPIKEGPGESIRSALVAFPTDKLAKSVLASAVDGQIRFTFEPKTEEDAFKVLAFDDYRRRKNKSRTRERREKMIRDFASLSISDQSAAGTSTSNAAGTGRSPSPPPKPPAFVTTYQVAKRSLLFESDGEPPMTMAELKTALSTSEVVYVYALDSSGRRYYVLFKNRAALNRFMDLIKEKPKEVTLQLGEESKAVLLSSDLFERLDPANLPNNFELFARRVRMLCKLNNGAKQPPAK